MTLQEEGKLTTEHVLSEWNRWMQESNGLMAKTPYSHTVWCGYALQTLCEELLPQQYVWQIVHNMGMYPTVVMLGYKPCIEELLSTEDVERLTIGPPPEEGADSDGKKRTH